MPPNHSKVKEAAAWLAKAHEDLETAKILFAADRATQWHQVLFHCQQAIEKMMKGFLLWNDTKFRWTHDLVELGAQCTAIDQSLSGEVGLVEGLTDYAWEFRYPGEDPDPTKAEAKRAIALAEKFGRVVLGRLPSDTHPAGNATKKKNKRTTVAKKKP